jgi:hypothetical protein
MPVVGPIPPYSNPPITPQNFQPSQFPITGITLGINTTVTMGNSTNGVTPNYVIGQEVRLLLPEKYGARQLNEQTAYVVSIPASNQVTINLYSLGADPFIASPTFLPYQSQTLPQIVAVGDINSGILNSTGRSQPTTNVPGSFINISS